MKLNEIADKEGAAPKKLLVTVLVASRLVLFPLLTPTCNHWPTISQEVVKLEKSRNWKCRRFTFKIRLYLTTGANFQRVLWKITVSVSSVRCTFHNFTSTESIWCVFVVVLFSSSLMRNAHLSISVSVFLFFYLYSFPIYLQLLAVQVDGCLDLTIKLLY